MDRFGITANQDLHIWDDVETDREDAVTPAPRDYGLVIR